MRPGLITWVAASSSATSSGWLLPGTVPTASEQIQPGGLIGEESVWFRW